MNSFYILVTLAMFCVVSATPQLSMLQREDLKRKAKIEKCKKETNLTDDEYDRFPHTSSNHSMATKCFIACSAEEFGMINADGSIDHVKARGSFESLSSLNPAADPDLQLGVWKGCHEKEKGESNKCEKAYKTLRCFVAESERLGKEETNKTLLKVEECRVETSSSKESIRRLLDLHEPEDTSEMRCFLRCAMEKIGAMDSNGNLKNTRMLSMFVVIYEHGIQEFHNIWRQCEKSESKDDRCNYAFNLVRCFKNHMSQLKLPKAAEA